MNILKAIFRHEVFPALGCTEPIAVAYAAAIAAAEAGNGIEEVSITVDPGVYKGGMAVTVPNTGGAKGNLIAGALGALIRKPELKMEILGGADGERVARAQELIESGEARIDFDRTKTRLYIDVRVKAAQAAARAVLADTHTNLVRLEKDDQVIFAGGDDAEAASAGDYREALKRFKLTDLIDRVEKMDPEDRDHIRRGVDMNLAVSAAGRKLERVGHYLSDLIHKGYLADDVFSSSKLLTAAAVDARMAGLNFPVMCSGGSGNQGIVAILVPYNVGRSFGVDETTIIRSIALAHSINSYIKCFTGELSPLCGCATAAGAGAAAAVAYQQCGRDMGRITLAVNNLISDSGGVLCDGAKASCAFKAVSATDAAIRAAYLAIHDHGIKRGEGFVGETAEETIQRLSTISNLGMARVDATMLDIMRKQPQPQKQKGGRL